MKTRGRRRHFIFRVSQAYSDVVFIALLAGAAANMLWHLSIYMSDAVGFIAVGGDIAGLMAYFGFIFFGCLYFWLRPNGFLRSIHPINAGFAQLFFPRHYPTATEYLLSISIPTLVGVTLGTLLAPRLLRLNPRLLLFLLILTLVVGWRFLPWGMSRTYALNGYGTFLIGLTMTALFLRHRKIDKIKKRRQERTAKARQRQQSASTMPPPQNQNDFRG